MNTSIQYFLTLIASDDDDDILKQDNATFYPIDLLPHIYPSQYQCSISVRTRVSSSFITLKTSQGRDDCTLKHSIVFMVKSLQVQLQMYDRKKK